MLRKDAVENWQQLRFGMFIHWGLYSLPGGVWNGQKVTAGYSEQILSYGGMSKHEYEQLATEFNPVNWDADRIVQLAKDAGMKYIVFTSKHHDGFNMYHTKLSGYNIVDATPFKRDPLKELAEACRRGGIKLGIYYSQIDWHFPAAAPMSKDNSDVIPQAHEEYTVGQLTELLTNYGPICEIWFDMGAPTVAQSRRFADVVHRLQPETMVNGRIWNDCGDFAVLGDNEVPDFNMLGAWETPASIYNETWGYRSWQKREDMEGKIKEKIRSLVQVVSRGGNYLLNIGPTGDGSIVDFEADVLRGIGKWLKVNGEAIFDVAPTPFLNHGLTYDVTCKEGKIYLHLAELPESGTIRIPGLRNRLKRVYILDTELPLEYLQNNDETVVTIPSQISIDISAIVVMEYEGKQHIIPKCRQLDDNIIKLSEQDSVNFYHFTGEKYCECKAIVAEKHWYFSCSPGKYTMKLICDVDIKKNPMQLICDGKIYEFSSDTKNVVELNLADADFHELKIAFPKRENIVDISHVFRDAVITLEKKGSLS